VSSIGKVTASTPRTTDEKRELRRIVQELEAENDRLRAQRDHYKKGLQEVRERAAKLMQRYGGGAAYHSLHTTAEHYLENRGSVGDGDD